MKGRPIKYKATTIVKLTKDADPTGLQKGRQRELLFSFLKKNRGRARLGTLRKHFAFEPLTTLRPMAKRGLVEFEL